MQKQPAIGAEVLFDFRLPVIIGGERRTGRGIVVADNVVGTDLAATIRVTESPDYPADEFITVRNRNLQVIA